MQSGSCGKKLVYAFLNHLISNRLVVSLAKEYLIHLAQAKPLNSQVALSSVTDFLPPSLLHSCRGEALTLRQLVS